MSLEEKKEKNLKDMNSEQKEDSKTKIKGLRKIGINSRDNQTELKKRNIEDLDREINKLKDEKELNVEELDVIIKKLHDYNEIKDLSLTLLDKVANFKCLPIKEVFKIYEIDDND